MPSWGIDEWRTAWAAALLTAGTASMTAMVVLTLTRTIFRILSILPGTGATRGRTAGGEERPARRKDRSR